MPIIDSQVHAYEANTPKRPWHTVPNWPDHVTGDEMVAAMDNLEEGTALIDRNPETRFIIDHLGILQPRVPPAPPQPSVDKIWADLPKVLELARRPNVVIKVSGACTLSREPYPFNDIWDPLARVFDAWGFERCLWGTDWT